VANTLITPTAVTREALRILHQKLNFIGNINLQYDENYAQKGAKIGSALQVRVPNSFQVRKGVSLSAQDTVETTTTITMASQYGVDLNFTSQDLTLSLDDFSTRILSPAMAVLAANIEGDVLSAAYRDVYYSVTNFGTAATFNKVLGARKVLTDNLAPTGNRTVCLQTQDNVDLVDALKGLFQDSGEIAAQYREGLVGRTGGFDWYENTLLPSHTRGAATAGFTTDTRTSALSLTSTAVSSLTVSALANGGINKGDIIRIANVNRAHPETKANTGVQQSFVLTADAASGATTISIAPSIILSGAYQNVIIPTVAQSAAATAEGTAGSTYPITLAFHRDAFAFVSADLVMPDGVDFSARDVQDGISMRIVRQYDINNDKFPCRLDVLFGYKAIRPQLACRLEFNGA
jgi:hypothetical protein